MSKFNKRIAYIDTARAISILWIVGILHVIGYVYPPEQINPVIKSALEAITMSSLALFTFISGYFVGNKPLSNKKEIAYFYKKRFKRFFILYFIACFSLLVAGTLLGGGHKWFNSFYQFLLVVFGLSGLIKGDQPATFWYFSMLILFYWITPLINYKKINKVVLCFIIEVLLLIETSICEGDIRLPFYFIFYCLGCVWDGKNILPTKLKIILFVLFAFVSPLATLDFYLTIINLTIALLGMIAIMNISFSLKNAVITSFFSIIAYSSMCAYLFHRHIFSFVKYISGREYSPIILWPFVVIITFFVGYYVQRIYDKLFVSTHKNYQYLTRNKRN